MKTQNKNEGYIEETFNRKEGYLSITEKKFQKANEGYQVVTEIGINFKKFLEAYNLNPSDPYFFDKYDDIMKQINKDYNQYRYGKDKFKLVFLLKQFKFLSFEQLNQYIPINKSVLAELLKDLQKQLLIKKETLLNPTIQNINEVLTYLGDTKKRQFYTLNYENEKISNNITELDNIMKQIDINNYDYFLEEKKQFDKTKQAYNQAKAEKEITLANKKKTRLDKIREALLPLIGQKKTSPEIFEYLHFGKSLIGKKEWKGRRNENGIYSGGWEDYLLKQGMLKIVREENKESILITPKIDKNPQIKEKTTLKPRLTNEEMAILEAKPI